MTIAYTTDRAVPGASVGGARHAGFGWVVRGQANSSKTATALKQPFFVSNAAFKCGELISTRDRLAPTFLKFAPMCTRYPHI
jgi:hypothetical protein